MEFSEVEFISRVRIYHGIQLVGGQITDLAVSDFQYMSSPLSPLDINFGGAYEAFCPEYRKSRGKSSERGNDSIGGH